MKRIGLGLGVMLILVACGGGDSGSSEVSADTSKAATVSSLDGKAILTLSAGSLPDGVTGDDLQIDWAEGISDEPGAPVAGVRLAPDGFVLNEVASLRFELPDSVGDQLMVVHVTQSAFRFIDGIIEEADDGTRFFTTSVDHFSTIYVYGENTATTLIAKASPETVTVDQSHLVTAEVWFEPTPFHVWIREIPEGTDAEFATQSRRYTFENLRPTGIGNSAIFWAEDDPDYEGPASWDPHYVRPVGTVDDVVVTFTGSSTCIEANSVDPDIQLGVSVEVELAAKGNLVSTSFLTFSRVVGTDVTEGFSDNDPDTVGADWTPLSAAVGETLKGSVSIRGAAESECGTSTTSTTTVPTTTTQPDTETESDVSVLDSVPGNASGQVDFQTHPLSPPVSPYTAGFDIVVDADTDRIKKTQQPSNQMTEGPIDSASLIYFTTGGIGYFEAYVGVICLLPDGSYFIAGYTFGGADSMAVTFQSLMDSIPGLDVSFSSPQSISVDPALAPNCDDFASNPWELADWMRANLGPSGPIPDADWDLVFSGGFQP